MTHKAHEAITLFLCLKNKKATERKANYLWWWWKWRVSEEAWGSVGCWPNTDAQGGNYIKRTICRLRNSWPFREKLLINFKGLLYNQNGLNFWASWKQIGHDCGWHLSKTLLYIWWRRNFSHEWGPIGLGSRMSGPGALWYIKVGMVFCLTGSNEN